MRKVFLTLGLMAVLSLPILAQRGGRGFGGGMMGPITSATLLSNKSVQDELKLTDDQKKDIKTAGEVRQKAFRKAQEDMDREGFQTAMQDYGKAMKKVADNLKTNQKERLLQIEVQLAVKNKSPRIFANPDVQKALKLTEKQTKMVKNTLSEADKDAKEVMEDAKGDFSKMREAFQKIQKLNQDSYAAISKSLDADQKKALETFQGTKFTGKGPPFEQGRFGPGGGGRRGGKDKKTDDF
jgi:hypothetical protein